MTIDWYDTIKQFYDKKHPLYTNEGIKMFVVVNMLTPSQYEQITGVEYSG